MKISIIGSGYVGLVTGISFASFGHKIIFIDIDENRIKTINQNISPIYESGLDDLMIDYKANYYATSNYDEAILNSDLTFICVGTPSLEDGSINYQYIKQASKSIGNSIKNKNNKHYVVVKSTVLPDTTEDIVKPIIEQESGLSAFTGFGLAMNPEFLREGKALKDFLNPDRIVIGINDADTENILLDLYKSIETTKLITSIKEAEMIKYVSNSFLATKISFANEIGNICKKTGVDSWRIFEGVGLDSRISPYFFRSGIGYGGSCFPKDVKALQHYARQIGESTFILDAIETVNEKQPLKLVEILKQYVNDLSSVTIGVLGLSFKPETDDIRESRAIPLVKYLIDKTNLVLFDPIAIDNFKKRFPTITYASSAQNLVDSCDVVLITTEWQEFNGLNYTGKIVIDGRRLNSNINSDVYEGVCW